jgi:hypothetical protein
MCFARKILLDLYRIERENKESVSFFVLEKDENMIIPAFDIGV